MKSIYNKLNAETTEKYNVIFLTLSETEDEYMFTHGGELDLARLILKSMISQNSFAMSVMIASDIYTDMQKKFDSIK